MKKRMHQIELFVKYPEEVQQEVFQNLIQTAKDTQFGQKYRFQNISNHRDFAEQVPIFTYEQFFPYIEKVLKGEQNVIWSTPIKWFAKSSGTTNAKSKFIPVSQEALDNCHFKGGKDMLALYVNNYPETQIFAGKILGLGGSQQPNQWDMQTDSNIGDVSAVLMKNLPLWAQMSRTPKLEVALMDNWEEKIEKIARATIEDNVTSMAGVPTWMLLLLNRVLEITNSKHILEVWPNMEMFVHGAVSFTPYRALFQDLIPSNQMHYLETYNASEGFFGIQDQKKPGEMLLMLDYGIYYEFIPSEDFDSENPRTLDISEVALHKNYAVVISTNAGLWRYKIGDTIKFTSLNPFRFMISGRTKHFINAFGEELMVENAETALAKACDQTKARVKDFTAAPRYIGDGTKGCHEWIIEFTRKPDDLEKFRDILDQTLREVNTDYDAKRQKDLAVQKLIIHVAPENTFYDWMKQKGKLGGQHKVPRLSNNREYIDQLLEMMNTTA